MKLEEVEKQLELANKYIADDAIHWETKNALEELSNTVFMLLELLKDKGLTMDTIHEFIYHDKDGRHVTTAVGNAEYNDMANYINQLELVGLVWDASVSIIGGDI
jgi:3-oxoacyl-[acyl-carrier-protein] synthase III